MGDTIKSSAKFRRAPMPATVEERLRKAGVAVGDTVRVVRQGQTDQGVLMPRHAFSDPSALILKLSNGYNVGLRLDEAAKVELVAKGEAKARTAKTRPAAAGKPVVAVLGTGGTIASFVDYRTGAVHPAATAEELSFATPELFEFVDVRAEVVYQVFSEDLTPANWLELAVRAKAAFDQGARGVVIPHGTDTLAYTSAALGFLLRDLPGPVVVVGAQRSSDRPSSDAATNLIAACRIAASADLGEVVVAMHASSSDGRIAIHRGTRVRKNHTSRRDAFETVNGVPLGHVEGEKVHLAGNHRPRHAGPCRAYAKIAGDVAYVHSFPGLTGEQLERLVTGRGAVLAGTGLGHVPRRVLDAVEHLAQRGALLAMASQCLWGRVNMNVYSTGRDLIARGVVSAEDMLPETAFAKMCWALGNAKDAREAAQWFQTDQVGETGPTTAFPSESEDA